MATAAIARGKDINFAWEGKDKSGKVMRGEMRAPGEAMVNATLRRQGIIVTKVKKQRAGRGGSVSDKDVTLFTRQLATMMKAGVPLLQSFDIVGKGHANPAVARLLMALKTDVETGSALATAFRKYPLHFDALFCNLVAAGEQAGILETLLDRALDPDALHHVRGGRAPGGGARIGRRRLGQLRLRAGHQGDPEEGERRNEPYGLDAGSQRLPQHGDPDGVDRRGIRRARRHARQGRGFLRGRGRRRGGRALQPDGAADHGGARRPDRRNGDRDVPADLQDRPGGLTVVLRPCPFRKGLRSDRNPYCSTQ